MVVLNKKQEATKGKGRDIKGLPYEEYFASGHRACAGCGEALMVRHVVKAAGPNSIAVMATGCMEVVSTPYPQTAWKIPWIHGAFENNSAIASGIDSALKMQGRREGTNLLVFGGDGASFDIGFGALSGAIERGHKFTYVCTDNEAYMNCLALDSLIMTKEGLKRIIDIEVGDLVYAFSQRLHKLVLKKCTGVFDNGEKRVFEINTDSQTIKATGNHPFLVLKRNGRGKQNELVWKIVEELQPGNEVVVLKQALDGKSYTFPRIQLSKKGDYKVNKIREIRIPKKSSRNLMKLLGLYVGDGWTRVGKAEIGFSVPVGNRARKPVKQLIKKVFGVEATRETDNEAYLGSINAAKFIDSLGFGKGARNKFIPTWVFSIPVEERKAFVEGLLLSDGYRTGNSYRYVSASKELLRTLRLLLQTMNIRVGKIHQQSKSKGTMVVYRKLKKTSTYGYIAFSLKKGATSKYSSQNKYRDFLYGNKNFEMKVIRSIKKKQVEPTLDLRVEGEHNFVANGIVVHNTGVQRSGATPFLASTTTSPAGKAVHGKQEPKKPLPLIVASHGLRYVATVSASNIYDLHKKVKKALATEHTSFIHAYSVCPVGWHSKSDSAITLSKLAVQSRVFPMYEIENGILKFTQKVEKEKATPVLEYLKLQGRFKHLAEAEVKQIQDYVDARYDFLLGIEGKKAFDVLF
jgi:pyruvate/2-oxoacid:ferredoxin oxidoreductase beta subunit